MEFKGIILSLFISFFFFASEINASSRNGRRSLHASRAKTGRHGLGRHPSIDLQFSNDGQSKDTSSGGACASAKASVISAPKENIWTFNEQYYGEVSDWLKKQPELNVSKSGTNFRDNQIVLIEPMAPNKTDALLYLEEGKARPEQYAHVLIDYIAVDEPYYQNLLVGPLPVRKGVTKWTALEYPFTKKSGGRIRDLYDRTSNGQENFLLNVGKSVEAITLDLWNATAAGYKNDTLYVDSHDPLTQNDGITAWYGFFGAGSRSIFDDSTLQPYGLYFQVNLTEAHKKEYKLMGWLYDDVFYRTTEDFKKAYWSKKIPRLPAVKVGPWAYTDQRGPVPPLDDRYPPSLDAPSGSRFFVDEKQNYVKWMDFEFYFIVNYATGVRLYNVKYKGKRILYELGMQEALAHYAGNDPYQSGTAYTDSYYSFLEGMYPLVNGYDCPSYSTYLDAEYFNDYNNDKKLSRMKEAICLFEMDAGEPIMRHSSSYIAATKNIFFTLKYVSTIGNYDYSFSYKFFMDGSIRVEVKASGYIQAAYGAKNHDYGYNIENNLSGSMHDHILNFKADFDIDGVENTFETVEGVPISKVYPWSNGEPRNTMMLRRKLITSEDESKLMWGPNGATQFKVTNLAKKNKWGEAPGYRILPATGAAHLTVVNSSNLINAAQWATHNLFVTKQKDTEPRSTDPYNTQDTPNPLIQFNKFFDGENLEQTDLVTWINLGMHHVPNTLDLPITLMTTAFSGVQFSPLNYLLESPTVETVNAVRIMGIYGKHTKPHVVTFGQDQGMCSVDYQSQTSFAGLLPEFANRI